MITLYDIPSKLPDIIWSPNTIKARVALAYKQLPYATEWVEYPDIEAKLKSIGGLPTSKKGVAFGADKDHYTLPAIYDDKTGRVIVDAWKIAEYLDEEYPDVPSLFPSFQVNGARVETRASIHIAEVHFMSMVMIPVRPTIAVAVDKLNPVSERYVRETRQIAFGVKDLAEVIPKEGEKAEVWVKFRENMGQLAEAYDKNRAAHGDKKGLWYFGEVFSYADAITIGYLYCIMAAHGKDSAVWKSIEEVGGGKWAKQLEAGKHLLEVK